MDTTKTEFRANSYYTEDAVKRDGYLYICHSTKGYWWLEHVDVDGRDATCGSCHNVTPRMLERYDNGAGRDGRNTLFCTNCAPALEKTSYRV